jgi:deoxyhypusine synthase
VVVYADSTVAAPIVFAYALSTRKKREPRRLFKRLPAMYERLRRAHQRRHPGSGALPELREATTTRAVRTKRAIPRR